jgi:hypothetical protein
VPLSFFSRGIFIDVMCSPNTLWEVLQLFLHFGKPLPWAWQGHDEVRIYIPMSGEKKLVDTPTPKG